AIALGAFRYLLKPIDIKEFLAVIGDALDVIQAQGKQLAEKNIESTIQSIIQSRPDAARALTGEKRLAAHGLPIGEQPACPILIVSLQETERPALKQALKDSFLGACALIPIESNQTLALLMISPVRHTPKSLRQTCAILQKNIGLPLQIIIGPSISSAAALHDAYAEITKLTEMLFFYPENTVLIVGEEIENEVSSIAYTKYLYNEKIINKLREAGLPQDAQARAVEELSTSKNLAELEQKAQEITENIGRSPAPGRLVEEIREIVEQTFMNKITVESLAAKVFRSPTYLSRMFKKATGESLSRYINRVRMENAAALLHRGGMTVSEAASRCGFADYSYFGALFREHFGVSPRRYQRGNADV
ncbi:MAG: DNA-binding response regulator, partial [Clostridia bacterium]|nr:DNA-binding response regulator [Clostridia bacterium]